MTTAWHLTDAEERSQSSAKFQIPPPAARRNLMKGDYAKLIFDNEAFDQARIGERMWVQVFNVIEPGRYVGLLCSHPVVVEGIDHGDAVEFEAKHVCAVDRRTA